ncbi:MAG: hypothetical protein V2I45_06615 [Halieaceae bacterium]|jgi:hypothetical protein|nr:hypothetical protein [Halieaceae bacterium]
MPAQQHEVPALVTGLSAASSQGRAVTGSAIQSRFVGHDNRSSKIHHLLTLKPGLVTEEGHIPLPLTGRSLQFTLDAADASVDHC